VPAPGLQLKHAARVTDRQRPHPVVDRPLDHGFGGLVLGLTHPPFVAGFESALA
jgi:hypothetical protein